jgi:hypothetical protein
MRYAVLLAFTLQACAGAAQAPATPATQTPATQTPATQTSGAAAPGGTFPTPYSAEQIRDASKPGRTWIWRVETPGNPTVESSAAFGALDAEGVELVSDGTTKRITWEELRRHAEFPRDAVVTREETVTVPAGTYDCIVYVVTDPTTHEVTSYYFAKDLPGAPVYFYSDKGGTRLLTSTLIKYDAGSEGP